MTLSDLYSRHGITLRKHTGEYPTWTERALTVVDLEKEDRRVLERSGDAALERHLRRNGRYPFPALTICRLKDLHRDTEVAANGKARLTIYVRPGTHYAATARWIVRRFGEIAGVRGQIRKDSAFTERELRGTHALILGGAHENGAAALLADRFFLDADLAHPGPRGLLIESVHNPFGYGHNVLQLCAGPGRASEAAERLLRDVKRNSAGRWSVGPIFVLDPDRSVCPVLHDRRAALKSLWRMSRHSVASSPMPARFPGAGELAKKLAAAFDSGGRKHDRYNQGPMRGAHAAATLYRRTGDRFYLELFGALLWEMLLYFTESPGGASYVSDMDFVMGWLVRDWDLLEESDAFADDRRLILTNFLLAASEMVAGYKRERWPSPPNKTRHNHETFPALSLFFAGRYFHDHYRLPVAAKWLQEARTTFSGPIARRAKLKENANLYQWLVPCYQLTYDLANGVANPRRRNVLRRMGRNMIVTTDNFGYPCDFGDSSPLSLGAPNGYLLRAVASVCSDAEMSWVAERICGAAKRPLDTEIGSIIAFFPGSRRRAVTPKVSHRPVEIAPLEDHIRSEFGPGVPAREAFDKLALREGWNKDSQYLLLEGYSAGSHTHRDQNAVIRYNQLGRLWIVDNGYGKRLDVKAVGPAFSTRQIGPEDHNLVQFILPDGTFGAYAPLCRLKTATDLGPAAVIQSLAEGPTESPWLRTLVWVKGLFVLAVDQVKAGTALSALKCQWNVLGRLRAGKGVAVCRQKGRRFFLHWNPATPVECSTYNNDSWQAELRPAIYPYARPPVQKLNEVISAPETGKTHEFATLFYATGAQRPQFTLECPAPGSYVVAGRGLRGVAARWSRGTTSVSISDGLLSVELPPVFVRAHETSHAAKGRHFRKPSHGPSPERR